MEHNSWGTLLLTPLFSFHAYLFFVEEKKHTLVYFRFYELYFPSRLRCGHGLILIPFLTIRAQAWWGCGECTTEEMRNDEEMNVLGETFICLRSL